jgi:hypothetical protein
VAHFDSSLSSGDPPQGQAPPFDRKYFFPGLFLFSSHTRVPAVTTHFYATEITALPFATEELLVLLQDR